MKALEGRQKVAHAGFITHAHKSFAVCLVKSSLSNG